MSSGSPIIAIVVAGAAQGSHALAGTSAAAGVHLSLATYQRVLIRATGTKKPGSPATCIALLTGGSLVRIQEPTRSELAPQAAFREAKRSRA